MNFEFDAGKNEINKAKHGVSFEQAESLWNTVGVEIDLGVVNGEYRYPRLGIIGKAVHLAVFSFRAGPAVRLISARVATEKEAKYYEQNLKK